MSKTKLRFQKYKSITGVWVTKEIAYLRLHGFDHPSIKWCVTEKAHGANFAFYMTLDEFRVAKRNSFLKEGENFFQYLRMKEANGYKIRNVWNQLVGMGKNVEELVVYGEILGGFYPHPDVPRLPNVQKVQKGVWYSNDIHFYCFDIMLNGKFLPMDIVENLCEFCDILYAKILFIGTFDECLNYPNQFQTHIPKWIGHPPLDPNEKHKIIRMVFDPLATNEENKPCFKEKVIEYYGNICEGIVIKPVEPLYYKDGNRVIFKSKNLIFDERSKEKTVKKKKQHQQLSDFAMDTLELMNVYVNENRLRNVLSKIGTFTKKDFKKVFDAFKKDVYEAFNINHDNLRLMKKTDKTLIDKIIGRLCTEIWKPVFLTEAEDIKK